MSILVKEDYVNPETALWAKNVSTGVHSQYSFSNSVGAGILMTTTPQIVLTYPGGVIPIPANEELVATVTYTVRVNNTTGTADNYLIDPILAGSSIRSGANTTYDYTTTGNGHWATITGIATVLLPVNSLPSGTLFNLLMKAVTGAGSLRVYSATATITLSYTAP